MDSNRQLELVHGMDEVLLERILIANVVCVILMVFMSSLLIAYPMTIPPVLMAWAAINFGVWMKTPSGTRPNPRHMTGTPPSEFLVRRGFLKGYVMARLAKTVSIGHPVVLSRIRPRSKKIAVVKFAEYYGVYEYRE